MLKPKAQKLFGLILLAILIAWFHQGHGKVLDYVLATIVVVAFWVLHSIQFSITNIRMLIVITGLFAIPLFFADNLPFFSFHEGTSGPWTAESFDPAKIGRIELSHEIAAQIYFDHEPKGEERYDKTGVFNYSQDGLRYQINKVDLDPGLLPLAQKWTERNLKGHGLAEQRLTIQNLLQNNFQYSLTPGTLDEPHPLDEFLFERKVGYCQHFAGATAALLKLSGTPARVVVGFAGGSWNPLLNTLTYEMADSHAWVEAYDSQTKTWITIDPTSWVLQFSPGVSPTNLSLALKCLAVLLLSGTLVYLTLSRRREPLRQIFSKVEKFEKRKGLTGSGLTLQERLLRMAQAQPKKSQRIEELVRLYQDTYFRNEPTPERMAKLSAEVSN